MGVKIPWLLLCCACVPLFMIYTKSKRMDARELHEITMRVKYYSEYWEKGNHFSHRLQEMVDRSVLECQDPLHGRDIKEITAQEWHAAERWAAQEAQEDEARHSSKPRKRFVVF